MKEHKWALIISIIVTALSLTGFLCSSLICFNGNVILSDICAALFSSSVFVIALSTIGYLVEKSKFKGRILSDKFFSGFDALLSVFDENNHTNRQGVNTIVIDLITRTVGVKYILSEYYYGLFVKDKQLKDLINKELFEFVRHLSELEVYNAYPSRNGEIIGIHLLALIDEYHKISDDFYKWMETRKFKLGKDFDMGDNFISEYEKKAQELKENKK